MPLCASAVDRPHITVFNRRDRGHGQCLVVRSTRSLATATWPRPGACSAHAPRWGIGRTFALHRGCHSGHSSTACMSAHTANPAPVVRCDLQDGVSLSWLSRPTGICLRGSLFPSRLLVLKLQRCNGSHNSVSLLYSLVLRSRHRSDTAPPSFTLAGDGMKPWRPNHRSPCPPQHPKIPHPATTRPKGTSNRDFP